MSTPNDQELAAIMEREENRRAIDSINAQVRNRRLTISQTILEQLGGNRFIAMTGAHNLVENGPCLQMRIGRNCKNVNYVSILLNSLDMYDMEFGTIRKMTFKKVDIHNVHVDDLQAVFTMHTGMDTHL